MRSHTVTVETATTVHISSSWTKRRWHASADVYTCNRNTGLRAAAEKEGMSEAEQVELSYGRVRSGYSYGRVRSGYSYGRTCATR